MTVNFYDAGNGDGLFDVLGAIFKAQAQVVTSRGDIITDVNAIQTPVAAWGSDAEIESLSGRVGDSSIAAKSNALGTLSTLQQIARDVLVKFVNDDATLDNPDLPDALTELIDQMVANSESVDASTVAATVAADAGNTGDGVIVVSTKRGDGRTQENLLAETITVRPQSNGTAVSLLFTGDPSEDDFSHDWPAGSGVSAGVVATDAASSLLANGDMEDEDDTDNAPDDWIISVGTIGTTIKMTNVEVQTLTVTGSPTAGHYIWQISHGGVTKATTPLAYNASASALQAAIRALPGFSQVTVAATGTSPNLTHTITFSGVGGNINQHTIINNSTGGTYTPGTTTAGSGSVYAGGKALELDSNGSELTTFNQRILNLQPETAYAVSLWALADVVPAAGVITIDLVDGIGGTVIQDSQGTNNTFTFDAADLTTSFQHLSDLVSGETVFRLPAVVPDLVYFRFRISTAVSSGTSVFVDELAMDEMTELYPGGPLAKPFSGATEFKTEDEFTLTTTNDRAGAVQEWMQRNFDMRNLGFLLPSDTGGAETIPDSVLT